jgi:hypothetical protein
MREEYINKQSEQIFDLCEKDIPIGISLLYYFNITLGVLTVLIILHSAARYFILS